MSARAIDTGASRIIVVGNEKGGSGKSTVAIQIAVALLKSGKSVATIDLDARQRSLTRYVENRRAWSEHVGGGLEIPMHYCFGEQDSPISAEDRISGCNTFIDTLENVAERHSFVVIDTPGHKTYMNQIVHSMADTLITPLNDSFVDLDVLGIVDPQTLRVTGVSHYANMVDDARNQRSLINQVPTDWIVLRNRLSMLGSRNKRLVGEGLQELSHRLNFRFVDGLSERVIFREFYPRGLTALDDVDEATLGTRPTMSHVTARQEVRGLLDAIGLSVSSAEDGSRDAA
jgi:chromosome partitioning protein